MEIDEQEYNSETVTIGVCISRGDKERLRKAAFEVRESISKFARSSILKRIEEIEKGDEQ